MWDRYKKYLFHDGDLGLILDISTVPFPDDYIPSMAQSMARVFTHMKELEGGALANPDEDRMVGHYWLRAPHLAPRAEIREEIEAAIRSVKEFARRVHTGQVTGQKGRTFVNYLLLGIGGSSLGPRFVSEALGGKGDKMRAHFIDNTDPDGFDRVFAQLEDDLDRTLVIVISKSGSTIETRNALEETRLLYQAAGLDLARHAVSITQQGSKLDRLSREENWLASFPMWDWVGGRTSVMSAVGLLPLALQGIDIEGLLAGARRCDAACRREQVEANPAALMTLMWYWVTQGRGGKQLVMLPYKDRLELLTKYLQQLVMESLGKEQDLAGNTVHQGLAVFGNKGSTDQHSYVQQLLEGPDNFFVTFIQVLREREGASPIVGENSTSGDYLQAFLMGTRKALAMKGRASFTITIEALNSFTLGVLLALFERTVSMYACLVNINAYHQPAVELGKTGAGEIIALKNELLSYLRQHPGRKFRAEELAAALGRVQETELVFQLLLYLAANDSRGVQMEKDRSFAMSYFSYHPGTAAGGSN
ncbi:MAG TPA: glucose-6-phosphate isomerase [Clostridia bacterium]|nr:glucose-6-phosphate isomerase [Clostridia bacterium]